MFLSKPISVRYRGFIENLPRRVGAAILAGTVSTAALAETGYLELLHLWAVKEERFALQAFADPVIAMGIEWQEDLTTSNFTGIKSILTERLALGVPPTVVQWIGGNEDVKALYDAGVFRLITREFTEDLSLDTMRAEIADIVSHENGYLLLPSGIHLLNHAVYNQDILDEIGAEIPQTWDEFMIAAREAKAKGYSGIAMSDERWQLRNLMFGLLGSEMSPQEFHNLALDYDEDGYDPDAVVRALRRLRDLQSVSNPDSADLPWAQAVAHMTRGDAMVSILGDFSSPLFPPGGRFTCALPPENDYLLWAFDTFALVDVVDEGALAGQRALVRAVSNPDNQATYIIRKGGIPAFHGVAPARLNACSQISFAVWESPRKRVFLTSKSWAQNLNVIANATRRFWRDPDLTPEEIADQIALKLKALNQNEQD